MSFSGCHWRLVRQCGSVSSLALAGKPPVAPNLELELNWPLKTYNMLRCFLSLALSLALVGGLAQVSAQENGTGKNTERKSQAKDVSPAEREIAALEFAREHHRELAELVAKLKDGKPRDYDRAIQELYRASERLARVKDRTPRVYEFELKGWKLDSRIRLLQARMTMAEDQELEDQLRKALTERAEHRIARLKADREQLTDNLRKVEERLAEAEKARDVEAELKALKARMAKSRPANRSTAKRPNTSRPAASRPTAKSVKSNDKKPNEKPTGKPTLKDAPRPKSKTELSP